MVSCLYFQEDEAKPYRIDVMEVLYCRQTIMPSCYPIFIAFQAAIFAKRSRAMNIS